MIRTAFAFLLVPLSLVALAPAGGAGPAPSDKKADPNKRICRSMDVTGKLAARRRVCMTRAEWERNAEEGRKAGQRFIDASDACRGRGEGGACPIG